LPLWHSRTGNQCDGIFQLPEESAFHARTYRQCPVVFRKTLEAVEAKAIGTEYLRADLSPRDIGAQSKQLLKKYLDLRVASLRER
jgi:hypothetical protein